MCPARLVHPLSPTVSDILLCQKHAINMLFLIDCSALALLSGHFIIWYEILALLKLEDHFGPSFQSVNDIEIRTHDLPGMLHSLFESSHVQHHRVVLH